MANVSIKMGGLSARIKADVKARGDSIKKAEKAAALRGRNHLVSITPVDMGVMRAAWQVRDGGDGVEIENDAPHAGIIERGARPHKVSQAGREALADWARRKGIPEEEIPSMVWGICKKLEAEGQRGLFLVKDSLHLFSGWLRAEVERAMGRTLDRQERA